MIRLASLCEKGFFSNTKLHNQGAFQQVTTHCTKSCPSCLTPILPRGPMNVSYSDMSLLSGNHEAWHSPCSLRGYCKDIWWPGPTPTFLECKWNSSDNCSDPQLGSASKNYVVVSPYFCPWAHCLWFHFTTNKVGRGVRQLKILYACSGYLSVQKFPAECQTQMNGGSAHTVIDTAVHMEILQPPQSRWLMRQKTGLSWDGREAEIAEAF